MKIVCSICGRIYQSFKDLDACQCGRKWWVMIGTAEDGQKIAAAPDGELVRLENPFYGRQNQRRGQ